MDFWLSTEGQMVNPVLILLFYKFSAEMSRAVGKAKVLLSAKALLAGAGLANTVPQMCCPQLESCAEIPLQVWRWRQWAEIQVRMASFLPLPDLSACPFQN